MFEFSTNLIGFQISIAFDIYATFVVLALCLAVYFIKYKKIFSNFEIVEMQIKLGNVGTVKLRPITQVRQIAYQIWVEIRTRKIGLKIDEEYDVIVEVFDSWYTFFTLTREMMHNIPVSLTSNKDTLKLIRVIIKVLNDGLRPLLTKWQARFRKWYDMKLQDGTYNKESPQIIQKKFSEFNTMIQELSKAQIEIGEFANSLHKLAFGIPEEKEEENA
jgi:hypothetical protein